MHQARISAVSGRREGGPHGMALLAVPSSRLAEEPEKRYDPI